MFRLANVLQIPFKGPEGIVTQYWRGQKQNHGHPVVLNAVVTKPEVEYVKERMGQYPGVEFIATYQRAYTPVPHATRPTSSVTSARSPRSGCTAASTGRATCRAPARWARAGSS